MKNTDELIKKIKQLETELKRVKSCKRYGLVWEDKPEIFEEKARNALPILQEEKNLRIEEDENKPNNIIIEGDNFHSLSTLSYTHKGKIDVIYIDPPYNTGNKDFIYNDHYVDKEDSYRHSKWLSFMNKRLRLAKDLLSDDGVIFISIDDNEFAQLKILCDEILGENNFVNNIVVKSSETSGVKMSHVEKKLPKIKEYLFLYSKNNFLTNIKPIKISKVDNIEKFKSYSKYYSKIILNIDDEPKNWNIISLKEYFKGKEISEDKMLKFKIENAKRIIYRTNNKTFEKIKINEKIKKIISSTGIEYIWWEGKQMLFLSDYIEENLCDLWTDISTINLNKEIMGLSQFSNGQKPLELIKRILKLSSKQNSTILDFFAGSGTTGHAVMELNKEDGGNRQFILCSSKENSKEEPEKNICKNITYERNKRVIEGYKNSKGDKIEGLGGNLRYYTTEFIKADKSIDDLRYSFIDMCDDLLCIKENTFNEVNLKNSVPELRLFKKGDKYTAILYDIHHFKDLLKLLEVLDGKVSVYIFSLSKDIFEEELEHFRNVTVQNIPDDILQTYNKIFNF